MSEKFDIIIIGAGALGVCTAYELAKKGKKTLNIDKAAIAGGGSTRNTCAIVRAHYSTYDGVAMAYEGFQYWNDWENYLNHVKDENGLSKFINTGSIMLKGGGGHWKKVLKHYKTVGVEFEEWDLETLKQKIPQYNFSEFWPVRRPEDPEFYNEPIKELEGGIFSPGAGYVNDPILSCHNVQRASEHLGSTYLFNAEVTEVRSSASKVLGVTLQDGTKVDAPVVINISGPHSYKVNAMAEGVLEGMNIHTKALRHEVHHVPAPNDYDYENTGLQTSDVDLGSYYRPEVGNTFLVGSEDPDCDPREFVDPDNFNQEISDAQYKAQVYRLARRIKGLEIPNQMQGIVDLYDVSDDWIPIYDKSDLDGFYMAVGTSGNQYKNAPVVGAMMAELVEKCEAGHDHDHQPIQFKTKYTQKVLNVGFYSRKREINKNSSFSVNG